MWLNRSQALGENLLLITLLNGHALNPLLLIYPDTQRSAHLSALIRAVSVWSRWKSTRRGTTGQCSEDKRLGRAQTNVGHLYPIPPPEAQRSPWKQGQKDCETQRQLMTTRNLISAHNRAEAPVNSQELWQGAQDLHKLKIKFQLEVGGCNILPPAAHPCPQPYLHDERLGCWFCLQSEKNHWLRKWQNALKFQLWLLLTRWSFSVVTIPAQLDVTAIIYLRPTVFLAAYGKMFTMCATSISSNS